jgi:hypothetical protein
MVSKRLKYLFFSLTGYALGLIYVIIFFYAAKYFHIPESSFKYFIFMEFYLVFFAVGIYFMILATNIKKR